ncbi:membrane dipeptidase [bacterium]|nr:membrane dipeptidase [bacterium]
MNLMPLIKALENHGFSIDDILKITSENWLRVLRETW